jgi:histidine phosphotransfer protein HptB
MSSKIDEAVMRDLKDLLGARFTELVDRFVQDGTRRLALLRSAVPTRDFDVIHAEAHGLKGSSRNIGANVLGDVCDELEQDGREGKQENLATLFAALEQEFAAVCTELRAYC